MKLLLRPAAAYALAAFTSGFLLGTVRVLVLAPRLGEISAVLVEVPFMLAASVFFARWAIQSWQVPARIGSRAAMGGLAFALLMLCELALSALVFGVTPGAFLMQFLTPEGWIGLAAQIVFAGIPALLLIAASRL